MWTCWDRSGWNENNLDRIRSIWTEIVLTDWNQFGQRSIWAGWARSGRNEIDLNRLNSLWTVRNREPIALLITIFISLRQFSPYLWVHMDLINDMAERTDTYNFLISAFSGQTKTSELFVLVPKDWSFIRRFQNCILQHDRHVLFKTGFAAGIFHVDFHHESVGASNHHLENVCKCMVNGKLRKRKERNQYEEKLRKGI